MLEANIDDLNPQVFGYVMDRLLEEGALDAFGMPVQMKKNRPGTLLTVLCRTEDAGRLTHLDFYRDYDSGRPAARGKTSDTGTRMGDGRNADGAMYGSKIASMNGTVTNYAPEYEDCRRIAAEHHVPLKTVMQEAVQALPRWKREIT